MLVQLIHKDATAEGQQRLATKKVLGEAKFQGDYISFNLPPNQGRSCHHLAKHPAQIAEFSWEPLLPLQNIGSQSEPPTNKISHKESRQIILVPSDITALRHLVIIMICTPNHSPVKDCLILQGLSKVSLHTFIVGSLGAWDIIL